MSLLFCHECGVELPISNQDGLCSGCSSTSAEVQYNVRAMNGGHYGPMPHHRVIEQLERGFHAQEDLISCDGGDSVPIEEHVDFAAYFIEGDSRSRELQDTVRRRKRKQGIRHRQELLGRIVKGLVVVSLVGISVWFSPDIIMLGQSLISQNSTDESSPEIDNGQNQVVLGATGIELLLEQLDARQTRGVEAGNNRGTTIEAEYDSAWAHLLTGEPSQEALAVETMERVLVRSGGEAWALSALILAKSSAMDESPEALEEIQGLISILGEIASDVSVGGVVAPTENWESELAFAALARFGGVWHEAVVRSERCLALRTTEPGCAWIAAEAWVESGDYERSLEVLAPVLELWPDSTELKLIQARALFGSDEHARAIEIINILQGESSGQGHLGILEVVVAYQMATGDFQNAVDSYEQILALGDDSEAVRFTLGRLRLQVQHDYDGAFELLRPIADNSSNLDHILQASHAARMVGEYEMALAYATTVSDARREWGPGVLAQAMALDALGRTDEAGSAFRQVRTGSLSGREAARFYVWVANFHNRQEFGRLATIAHRESARYDEDSSELIVSQLNLSLFVGGKQNIVDVLSEIHLLDLEAESMATPLVDNWYPSADTSNIAVEVASLFAQDPLMSSVFDRTIGLAGMFDCLKGINCSRVIHHLNLALERDGTDVAALAGLGRVYFSLDRFVEATRFLQRALGEAGDSTVLQSMYGDSLRRVGREPEAEVAFQQALHTSGNSSVAARRYAVALADWGRLEEAAEVGTRALLLDENDTETLRLLVAAGVAVE